MRVQLVTDIATRMTRMNWINRDDLLIIDQRSISTMTVHSFDGLIYERILRAKIAIFFRGRPYGLVLPRLAQSIGL